MKFRTGATGAKILEVPGVASGVKADLLASKLREVLCDSTVKIQRPTKRTELRIMGLDDSVTPEEVARALATEGRCQPEEIKTGSLSANSMWISCPLIAAKEIIKEGKLRVGWVTARVRLLEPRPLRCYRCQETGHVGAKCKHENDRSDICYRCGRSGHTRKECRAEPNCAICAAANRPANHSIGDKKCPDIAKGPGPKVKGKQVGKKKQPEVNKTGRQAEDRTETVN